MLLALDLSLGLNYEVLMKIFSKLISLREKQPTSVLLPGQDKTFESLLRSILVKENFKDEILTAIKNKQQIVGIQHSQPY